MPSSNHTFHKTRGWESEHQRQLHTLRGLQDVQFRVGTFEAEDSCCIHEWTLSRGCYQSKGLVVTRPHLLPTLDSPFFVGGFLLSDRSGPTVSTHTTRRSQSGSVVRTIRFRFSRSPNRPERHRAESALSVRTVTNFHLFTVDGPFFGVRIHSVSRQHGTPIVPVFVSVSFRHSSLPTFRSPFRHPWVPPPCSL